MHNRESILESLYWITYNGECIRDLQYSRPESMGIGSIVQQTRVNGYWIYITVDQSHWVLELQNSRPESRGSGAIVQWTRVNRFWHHIAEDQSQRVLELKDSTQSQWVLVPKYSQPETMGSGTICITDDQSQWVLELQSSRLESMGVRNYSRSVVQQSRVNGVLELYYGRPESMGSGTIVQLTRVNGLWIYIKVDQSQWGLELLYSRPEPRGSELQYSAVNQSQWTR